MSKKGKIRRPLRRMKKRTNKTRNVSVAVKKYVKATIHKQIENKGYQIQFSREMGGFAANNALYVYPLTPYTGGMLIGQGTTQSSRLGNQIKPRSLTWDIIMSPLPYNASTNSSPQPLEIEIYICSLKMASGEIATAVEVANMFQLNASSTAPTGSLVDFTQKINTDIIKCHKRIRMKLGFASFNGTGNNAAYQSFNNNDFKLNVIKRINLTKYCPKVITYNDNSSTPTSRCLFALFNISPAIGGTQFAGSQLVARIDSTISLVYEDA